MELTGQQVEKLAELADGTTVEIDNHQTGYGNIAFLRKEDNLAGFINTAGEFCEESDPRD